MKKVICLILILFSFYQINAQNKMIEVELLVKGKPLRLKKGIQVVLTSKDDTTNLLTDGNSFLLPDSLYKKRRDFIIYAGGYKFYFEQQILTYQPLLPKWIISYDYIPFLEENDYLLTSSNQKIHSLYSLNYNTGSLFTYFNPEKLKCKSCFNRLFLRRCK